MFTNDSTVILVALKDELPVEMLPDWRVIYTGVGKINATFHTYETINQFNPRTIVNFGTAGSLKQGLTGLHEVSVFKQRDMDARGLGFSLGETPFDSINTISNFRDGLSCGSGDNFVDQQIEMETDLVDMEAYAIAKVCKLVNVEFYCFKYISDTADENAGDDWGANVKKGANIFSSKILSL